MPGETLLPFDLAAAEEVHLGGTTSRRGERVIVRGEGCWLWDSGGRRLLDFASAQGVALLGHCHPAVSRAVADQAGRLIACPNFLYNDVRARFASALAAVLPPQLPHLFIANSGAETVDGALKFARLATGRPGFVAAVHGFHGRTIGALSATWEPKYRKPFEPLLEVAHVPYNNLGRLAEAVTDDTAAVLLEVVQGEGGVHVGTHEFLQGAQELCRQRGTLLVIDEIQTGFGRTGTWFGFHHFDLQPDVLCLAKGLGGGFPIGAIAYGSRVHNALYVGAHGSTFGGGPLACAAGLAALQAYGEDGLIERGASMGVHLRARLEEALKHQPQVREVRGLGLMIGVELRQKVGPLLRILLEEHDLIALPAGPNVLRLLPPLVVDEAQIDQAVTSIEHALRGLRG